MAKQHYNIPMLTDKEIERFWSKVDIRAENECWPWLANTNKDGYGGFSVGPRVANVKLMAHRVAYWLHYGIQPLGKLICHSCDNPPCVNPRHLWLGTASDNFRDAIKKGRRKHIPTYFQKHPDRAPKGIDHHNAKLNPEKVREIREKRLSLYISNQAVADEYGVNERTIRYIIDGITWKHVK